MNIKDISIQNSDDKGIGLTKLPAPGYPNKIPSSALFHNK